MLQGKRFVSEFDPIYRVPKVRSKLLMRADSITIPFLDSTNGQSLIDESNEKIFRVMKDVKMHLQLMFETKNPTTFCIGKCANEVEVILRNFIDETDVILIVVIGERGKQVAALARHLGATVHTVEANPGQIVDFTNIERHLKQIQPSVFFVTHGESSTGVLQPLNGLGALCHQYDCLMIADFVNTLGAVRLDTDKWQIDVAYSTSQMALGSGPGLIPITVSSRGIDKLKRHRNRPMIPYWDVRTLSSAWLLFNPIKYLYSELVPVSSLYELRENLRRIQQEGLVNVIKRHHASSQQLESALERMGLELFVEEKRHRLPTVIAVKIPQTINERRFSRYLLERHSLEISLGLGGTTGQVLRIGLMNGNSNKKIVNNVQRAFYDALKLMVPTYVKVYQRHPIFYY